MLGVVADREQRRVQPRVERLDAAVEDLRRPGQVLDRADRRRRRRSSAAAVPPVETISIPSARQPLRELDDPALVGDRDQRPPDPQRLRPRLGACRPSAPFGSSTLIAPSILHEAGIVAVDR